MKKIWPLLLCLLMGLQLSAQNCYWVFFTDKSNTQFDPYQYFDAKAIARYQQNGQSLYDISNYPVNSDYAELVAAASEQMEGASRWLNAVAVTATEAQIQLIDKMPFVKSTQLIAADPLSAETKDWDPDEVVVEEEEYEPITMMQGEKFKEAGLNGKGVRIAVIDGGFPDVNTHPAFKHLMDNHQIVKTWNFTRKKENVYCAHKHGRMVLSCLAGISNYGQNLGLATGAEYLLACAEIKNEVKKGEIWWVQALEWADQNGADIVNSSMGFATPYYETTQMDGKTSVVAKAAQTAARKGILLCNAMGNEAMNIAWETIITPADADSILSVGAVFSKDNLAYYSSKGPTADGRLKPNVAACGKVTVADDKGNFTETDGTSFASPLVAGFAACVKQLHPDWTVMQLLQEIEKSGHHYPYYDYAFGYGVPQAGYFLDTAKVTPHTFDLYENKDYVIFVPRRVDENSSKRLLFNIANGDGSLQKYNEGRYIGSFGNYYNYNGQKFEFVGNCIKFGDKTIIINDTLPVDTSDSGLPQYYFSKSELIDGQSLNFWYAGQYAKYTPNKDVLPKMELSDEALSLNDYYEEVVDWEDPEVGGLFSKLFRKKDKKFDLSLVMNTSFVLPPLWSAAGNLYETNRFSRTLSFSFVNNFKVTKIFDMGFRLGFGSSWYAIQDVDPAVEMMPDFEIVKNNLKTSQFDLEYYLRFNVAKYSYGNLYFDLGVYGDWVTGSRYKFKAENGKQSQNFVEKKYMRDEINKLNCGARVRFGLTNSIAVFGQYRITSIFKKETNLNDLPKWEVGIQIY